MHALRQLQRHLMAVIINPNVLIEIDHGVLPYAFLVWALGIEISSFTEGKGPARVPVPKR